MKSKIKPVDQYKFSMEARPLRVLYSKYNANETSSSLQIVRPLGRIRKDRRLPPDAAGEKRSASRAEVRENGAKAERLDLSNIDENKMKPDQRNGHENWRSSNQNASRLDLRESENASPILGRSRTQDFEHKYKLAAARRSGQESPPLTRSHTSLNKKVIHLPLFRVNLKTYSGDTQVTQAVARTRESLRKLMEIHRCKMKPANLITANIRNYEFSAPSSMSRSGSCMNISTPTVQPFPAKPTLKSSKTKDKITKQTSFVHKRTNALYCSREYIDNEIISQSPERDEAEKKFSRNKMVDFETDYNGNDDSMWSLSLRPDTSLTLGSTMNQIDRVIKSPTSDELRELSEVFKSADSHSAWPSVDELRLRSRQSLTRRSKTSMSKPGTVMNDPRPGTVLNNVPETPEEVWNTLRNDEAYAVSSPSGSYSPQKPVLRYTSKQSSFKLTPIIVPSHTCTECEMCNLYQRELVETACPPNSPTSTQCPDPFFNQETKVVKSSSGRLRPVGKPEVMHIARINMDGVYVNDEGTNFGFMKANG